MKAILRCITLPVVAIIFMGGGKISCLFGTGAEFLIITYDDYYAQACSLAEWKNSKGIYTKVVTLTELDLNGPPTTNAEIWDYIHNAYGTWDTIPRYVLLLGDDDKLATWNIQDPWVNCTDNPYGDMGGDYHAEIAVGRFAADNLDKCKTVIAKTLFYERDPLRSGSEWLHHATLILNDDSESGWPPYYETCDHINDFLISYWSPPPPEEWVDYFIYICRLQIGDDREDVIAAVNEGRQLVVYRGPGSPSQWEVPFDFMPDQWLTNEWKLPIVISGTCYHGRFNMPNFMCNNWLHAGTVEHPKGAVAFLGTSTVLDGYEGSMNRHYVTTGIFDGIFRYDIDTLGKAFVFGKDSMVNNYDPYEEQEYYGWNLIGDPTLTVWTNVPKLMTVQHPTTIEMDNPTDITVIIQNAESQPFEDAWVTLYKRDASGPEVFQRLQADASGIVTFNDVVVPTSGDLKVTVTYHYLDINYVPYQGTIKVYEIMTDDPQALAYNGNRHMVRETSADKLHITYTDNGHVFYRYSTDYGVNWTVREDVGTGSYPCIALGPFNTPAIAWTNSAGYLYFANKSTGSWQTTVLYQPMPPNSPLVNSPPAMIINLNPDQGPPMVHILATLTDQGAAPLTHEVRHYSFNYNSPTGMYATIETAVAPVTPLRRHSPTLVRNEIDNCLHAAWMRMDTISYARKATTGSWVKYGNPFTLPHGILSSYPFIESYGDSIYLVWQEKESPTAPEEIWRGSRLRNQPPSWTWQNLSYTPTTISLYPVNASALYTVFDDEASNPINYDILYKIRPTDPLTNISQTSNNSYYPQATARFTMIGNYLYTIWLEGSNAPYEIKFKTTFTPFLLDDEIAFLSSFSGDSVLSPYLTARDGYNSNWQVPTDYGNQKLTYRLPLDPAYLYKAKVIAYHERTAQWKAACKIDGGYQMVIKYNPHIPETLTFWIPPQLYQDSIVEVTLSKVAGDFVSMGQIYVYRYEAESRGNGGPQSRTDKQLDDIRMRLHVQPNPVLDAFTLTYTVSYKAEVKLTVYDAMGRIVVVIDQGVQMPGSYRKSISSLDIPQGIYFIRLVAGNTTMVEKAVFLK